MLDRFMQTSPIGDGVSWYAYTGGDPVNRVDPFGLDSKEDDRQDLIDSCP